MTHISKITKAQLVDRVRDLEEALTGAQATAAKLQALVPTLAQVPEAEALAGCVRAIRAIPAKPPLNSYSSSNRSDEPDRPVIRRVLVSLADRYGIDLIERTTEPCSRPHIEQINVQRIMDAVGQAVLS